MMKILPPKDVDDVFKRMTKDLQRISDQQGLQADLLDAEIAERQFKCAAAKEHKRRADTAIQRFSDFFTLEDK